MIAPNTLLQNRYLVSKQIGQGGMGAVYLATDQRFGSTVALKETFFDDAGLRKAFEREARLLNHLRHPALPRVSDHFTEGEGQFLVMEFIPGSDLSEMLKETGAGFPASDVLEWADQLLDALDYLHTHEPPVIHRDIKPQNLKLTARGHIVLLDFGLAKGTPLQASRVTATGSLFGYSFNYAPLEQMQGTGTDPRSDLYSLGATLYHLLTNVTPPDALTRATALVNGEPDPLRPANEVHAQVAEPVARVLAGALAQSAAKRPQTAAAMREALRDAGKQVEAAALPTIIQPSTGANLLEQDTQLIGARTATPAAEGVAMKGQTDSAAGIHEAATVLQSTASDPQPSPLTAPNRDAESVITRVKSETPRASKPWLQNRAFSIVMGVVLVAIVAAVVYTFTRQSATQTQTLQPTPPSEEAKPEPSASAPIEARNPDSSPAPSGAPTTTTQPDSNKPVKKIITRKQNSQSATTQEPTGPTTIEPPEPPPTPNKRPFGLRPEDRATIAEEIRRAKQARHEAQMKRREQMRQQREQTPGRGLRRRLPQPPPY